jgi:hypothetical protein
MTVVARDLFVFADQNKFGLFVVKTAFACIFPRPLYVAVGTGLAGAPKVWVIFFVTIYAIRRCIAVLNLRFVTPIAFDLFVSALKGKVRCPMIKYFLVQQDDVPIPSLVFSMTVLAWGILDVFASPMKSLPFVNIDGNLFVTFQAKTVLRCFFERLVATGTIVLILDMTFYDFPGHNKTLQSRNCCRFKCRQRYCQDHKAQD